MVASSVLWEEAVRGPHRRSGRRSSQALSGANRRGENPPPTSSLRPGQNRGCVGTRTARRRGPPAAAPAHQRGPGGVGGMGEAL